MAITRRRFLTRSGLLAAGGMLGTRPVRAPAGAPGLRRDGRRPLLRDPLPRRRQRRPQHRRRRSPTARAARCAPPTSRRARTGGGGLRLRREPAARHAGGRRPADGRCLLRHADRAPPGPRRAAPPLRAGQGRGHPGLRLPRATPCRTTSRARSGSARLPTGGSLPGGWLGRYLAANYGGSDIPGRQRPLVARRGVRAVGDERPHARQRARLRLPVRLRATARIATRSAPRSSRSARTPRPRRRAISRYVGASARATLLSSESYPALHGLYQSERASFDAAYDQLGTSLGRRPARDGQGDLRRLERRAERRARASSRRRNGGYDTHSDQGAGAADGQHTRLHRELGDAIELFYEDCADMGVADKVCIMVWSEFSRRVKQNDNGTDHGSQGPVFVIGGGVQRRRLRQPPRHPHGLARR